MKKSGIKTVIIMFVIVGVLIGLYGFISARDSSESQGAAMETEAQKELTAVQKLISEAPYKDYPATPVQVVKYYNEITACFYNESYSDEQLMSLARLSRSLFDEELKATQGDVDYLIALKADIQTFKKGNITIFQSTVSPSTDVEYFTHDGHECAKLYCTYTLKSGSVFQGTREVYILRKDAEGHWRIFGFDIVTDEDVNG
ncbi:MAG: hypothetical protein K6E77_04330 [Lachnospiraceae bacterium]|nr:hypothetical protein [Lachnospiraceae bacterium]